MEVPTIQEVLDRHFPGQYVAEEVVLPSGEKVNLEENTDADNGKEV